MIGNWLTIDLAAQAATILAFLISLLGFLRERKTRRQLERRAQIIVWSDIAKLRGLMTDLEKPLSSDGHDFGKHQAVGKLTSMYRDKVREVYELSPKVAPEEVKVWRASGKIASDWQESCFWETFPQKNLKNYDVQSISVFSSLDELPETHHMAAKPKSEPQTETD